MVPHSNLCNYVVRLSLGWSLDKGQDYTSLSPNWHDEQCLIISFCGTLEHFPSRISLFSKGSQAWMHLGQFCFLNNKWHYQYYFFGDCPYPVNIFTLLAVFVASKSRDCHTEGEKSYFLYLQQYQWADIRNKTICASVRYLLYRIDENGWPTFSEDQRKKRMLTVSAPALATLIPAKWSHPCSLPFFLTVSVSVPPVTIDCIPSTIGECKYLVLISDGFVFELQSQRFLSPPYLVL